MKLTVGQLAERIGGELVGAGVGEIAGVGAMETAGESDVTFITDSRHIAKLKNCRAAAVIVGERIEGLSAPQLIVKNVNAALIESLKIFAPKLKAAVEGIDPTAKVGERVKIANGVSIGANVVLDDGVELGVLDGVLLGVGVVLGVELGVCVPVGVVDGVEDGVLDGVLLGVGVVDGVDFAEFVAV